MTSETLPLYQIVSGAPPDTVDAVILRLKSIDSALSTDDGLKWFNLLYLSVTEKVRSTLPASGWANAQWLTRLDVVFATLYFTAIAQWCRDPDTAPRAWQALFEVRSQGRISRLQFALAGMNAHINYDLFIAVVQVCHELNVAPQLNSPEHRDFQHVNTILEALEPELFAYLATGIEGVLLEDLGKLRSIISMWSVRAARQTAWSNAELFWHLRHTALLRDPFVLGIDRMTGYAGRGLLLPIA